MACDDSVTSPHVRRIRELEAELAELRKGHGGAYDYQFARAEKAEARVAKLETHCCVKTRGGEYWARAEKAEGRLQDEVLQQQQDLQRAIRAEARVAELLREACPRHAEGYHSVRCVRIDEAREKEED